MLEIGNTLREARMRARIDITEVESATKIRAKYLRALENEEWGLLPGSTFVKSFLREYADYLGLDSRSLVEEYKIRYERPQESELYPIGTGLARDRGRTSGGGTGGSRFRGGVPPWALIAAVVVALLVILYLVGTIGGGDPGSKQHTTTTRETGAPRKPAHRGSTTPGAGAPARASVRITPTGPLYVCLVDENGKRLIDGVTLSAGQQVPIARAKSMRLTLGNPSVVLHVNGRPVTVPQSAHAIGYAITTAGAKLLPAGAAPTCQ